MMAINFQLNWNDISSNKHSRKKKKKGYCLVYESLNVNKNHVKGPKQRKD